MLPLTIGVMIEFSQLKTVRTLPALTFLKKGGIASMPYLGPRNVENLVSFVEDVKDSMPSSPKVCISNTNKHNNIQCYYP